MTFKGKLQVLACHGFKITIRYGSLMSVKLVPFQGFRVNVTDEIMHGWIGEDKDLGKAVDIVYKKLQANPPSVKFN